MSKCFIAELIGIYLLTGLTINGSFSLFLFLSLARSTCVFVTVLVQYNIVSYNMTSILLLHVCASPVAVAIMVAKGRGLAPRV